MTFAACGDDEPDKFKDKAGFCNEWAIEACNTTIVEECADDKDDCRAGQRAFCNSLIPASKYNKAGASECIDAVGQAYVDGSLDAEERAIVEELAGSCSRVVTGNGEQGDSCDENLDCASDQNLECVIKPGEPSGECQEPREVGGGDDCDGDADVCESGTFCDGELLLCRTLRSLDDTCSAALPCDDETMCLNEAGELVADPVEGEELEEGTCAARGGNQDDCTVNKECLSGICSPGGKCVNKIDIRGDSTFNSCENFQQ